MGRRIMSLAVAAAFALLASGCWYQAGFDPGHSSDNTLESTITPSNVASLVKRWNSTLTCSCGGGTSSPVATGKTMYLPVFETDLSGKPPGLVSLNEKTGAVNWEVPLPGAPSTPAIGNTIYGGNGLVFVTLTNGDGSPELEAVQASTGIPAWVDPLGGQSPTAPTLAAGPVGAPSGTGTIYVSTTSGLRVVQNFTTDGTYLKTSAIGTYSSPVAIGNGLAYVGGSDGTLQALNSSTLAPVWSASVATAPTQGVAASPAVSSGNVYAASLDGDVGGFNATTGAPLWHALVSGSIPQAPAVGGGQMFVTANQSGGVATLYAFDMNSGGQLWSHNDPLDVSASGPVLANGLVYYDNGFGNLDALIPSTGHVQAQLPILVAEEAPPIVDNGQVFAVDSGGVQADSP